MWSKQLSKEEFVDVIAQIESEAPITFRTEQFVPETPPNREAFYAIWQDEPIKPDLPRVIVVRDDDLTNFLAWVVTFFVNFRPFTSFCRVVPWTLFCKIAKTDRMPDIGGMENICLGTIFSEALTESKLRGASENISVHGFASTFSYAMARFVSLYKDDGWTEVLMEHWLHTREWTNQPSRSIPPRELKRVWAVITGLNSHASTAQLDDETRILWEACTDLRDKKRLDASLWMMVSGDAIEYERLREQMLSRKEERVRIFEQSANSIRKSRTGSLIQAFALGYIGSLISESGLMHADLLAPYLKELPTSLLWYGVCSGIQYGSKLRSERGGMGRRLMREIQKSWSPLDRPEVDISFDEFEVLFNSGKPPVKLIQESGSVLSIELLPGVTSYVNWPPKQSDARQPEQLRLELTDSIHDVQQLGRILEQALLLQRRLSADLQINDSGASNDKTLDKKRKSGRTSHQSY